MAPSNENRHQEAGVARADGVYRWTARRDKRITDLSGIICRVRQIGVRNVPTGTCVDVLPSGILLPAIPDSSTVERPAVNR